MNINRRGFVAAWLAPVLAQVYPKPKSKSLKVGDILTFSDVYQINPPTRLFVDREFFVIGEKIGDRITVRKPKRFRITSECHS